ncbi:MAG: glycosyltransferase family 4 protein [Nitrospirae bacterium]|nr:glycosyltransferase family 4 protein [Nitrospirota bacterium]
MEIEGGWQIAGMNILYVNDNSDIKNGSSAALVNIVKGLDRDNYIPFVCLPHDGPLNAELKRLGVKTFTGNWQHLWFPSAKAFYTHLKGINNRIAMIGDVVKDNNIDLIHCNSIFALEGIFTALLRSRPSIMHVHMPLTTKLPFSEYFPLSPEGLGSIISMTSEMVVTVSKEMKAALSSFIREDVIDVVYNGIDTEEHSDAGLYTTKTVRDELGIPCDIPLICSVGRIIERKGFEEYVAAADIVLKNRPAAHFILVGPEEDEALGKRLKMDVTKYGINKNFHFLGPRQDVRLMLKEIDIFVCASRWEGHPMVCLEAMVSGKPVVAAEWGSASEVLTNGETAIIVEPRKPEDIAEGIIKLIDNPEMARQMGARGRKDVEEKFSCSSVAHNFQTLYSMLMSKKRKDDGKRLKLEIALNLLSNIGELAVRHDECEQRLRQLEGFMAMLKDNFIYRGAKKARRIFSFISAGKVG